MLGTAMRLLAAGEAGRRLGGYVKNLTARYLMLAVAGIIFSIAGVFGILAGFWALNTWMQNPIWTALILLGIFAFLGLLTVLAAYGTTRETRPGAKQAIQNPIQALESRVPTVEDVAHQIEESVRRYGPLPVAAAAAAGGIVAGLLAKRFGQLNAYEPSRGYPRRRRDYYGPDDDRRGAGRYA